MAVKMCFQSFYLPVMTNLQTWLRRTVKISVDHKRLGEVEILYIFLPRHPSRESIPPLSTPWAPPPSYPSRGARFLKVQVT